MMTCKPTCPFCGNDPYHYVDNGVGMEAVAVTCCELGVSLFSSEQAETVTIGRSEFNRIADVFSALRTIGADPNIFAA